MHTGWFARKITPLERRLRCSIPFSPGSKQTPPTSHARPFHTLCLLSIPSLSSPRSSSVLLASEDVAEPAGERRQPANVSVEAEAGSRAASGWTKISSGGQRDRRRSVMPARDGKRCYVCSLFPASRLHFRWEVRRVACVARAQTTDGGMPFAAQLCHTDTASYMDFDAGKKDGTDNAYHFLVSRPYSGRGHASSSPAVRPRARRRVDESCPATARQWAARCRQR